MKESACIELFLSDLRLKYGRRETAPIGAFANAVLEFVLIFFSKRGKPLAPVPPNIELIINTLSPLTKLVAKVL